MEMYKKKLSQIYGCEHDEEFDLLPLLPLPLLLPLTAAAAAATPAAAAAAAAAAAPAAAPLLLLLLVQSLSWGIVMMWQFSSWSYARQSGACNGFKIPVWFVCFQDIRKWTPSLWGWWSHNKGPLARTAAEATVATEATAIVLSTASSESARNMWSAAETKVVDASHLIVADM